MPSQPICKQCGQRISGQSIQALGATWHPQPFLCARCSKPLTDTRFQVHEGKPYHPECYQNHVAPRCSYCGKPLMGEYLRDYWGNLYCKEHENQYPKCSYCGRLVPPQQQESGTKHREDVRCPVCRASAVESSSQAQAIFSRLKEWANRQGLANNNLNIQIELCDRARLTKLMRENGGGRIGTDTLGITLSSTLTQNGQEVRTDVTGIAVLQGLPSTLFQGVTLHELGHAWLIMQGIKGMPDWAVEGFCELLAYRFYIELNTPESRYHAASIEKNPDKIYGEGFRRVRKIVDTIGLATFVELLRTTKRLPST